MNRTQVYNFSGMEIQDVYAHHLILPVQGDNLPILLWHGMKAQNLAKALYLHVSTVLFQLGGTGIFLQLNLLPQGHGFRRRSPDLASVLGLLTTLEIDNAGQASHHQDQEGYQ